MKKYLAIPVVLLALACNSNDDKKADEKAEAKADSTIGNGEKEPKRKIITDVPLSVEDTTSGSGLLSGKFELIDYKKNNIKVPIPKTYTKFTKKGEFIKNDGTVLFYKIEGDIFTMLASKDYVINKSKIEFLNDEKTSFRITNPTEKTEFLYQQVNK